MSARKNKAFTLTEMLVVISIIGVLVSMLLPAVQHAREAARRATCLANLRQSAKGIITYDARKGFLPASRTYVSATVIQNWVVPVLPMIERQDLADTIRFAPNNGDPNSVKLETIPVLLCPDDPEINKEKGLLSYKVNGGRANENATIGGTAYTNFDYLANGMLVDKAVAGSPPAPEDKISLDRVHDGASSTILLAENLIALSRTYPQPYSMWALAPNEQASQVLWFPIGDANLVGLNQDDINGSAPSDLRGFARPASYHPGGFCIAFGDESTRFMNESVDYKVYGVLMSSYGEKTKKPSNATVDAAWQSPSDSNYPGTKF